MRALAGYLALALLVAPLMACSMLNKDDDYVPDDPADKLYNQGLLPAEPGAGLRSGGEEIR